MLSIILHEEYLFLQKSWRAGIFFFINCCCINQPWAPCWCQALNTGGRAMGKKTRAPSQASVARFSFFVFFIFCFNRIQDAIYYSTSRSIHFYKNREETIRQICFCISYWCVNQPWAPCWIWASNPDRRAMSTLTCAPSPSSIAWFSFYVVFIIYFNRIKGATYLLYVEVPISTKKYEETTRQMFYCINCWWINQPSTFSFLVHGFRLEFCIS